MDTSIAAILRWLLNGNEVTTVVGPNPDMIYLQGPPDDGPGRIRLTIALTRDGYRELIQAVTDQGGGLTRIGDRYYLCRSFSFIMPGRVPAGQDDAADVASAAARAVWDAFGVPDDLRS